MGAGAGCISETFEGLMPQIHLCSCSHPSTSHLTAANLFISNNIDEGKNFLNSNWKVKIPAQFLLFSDIMTHIHTQYFFPCSIIIYIFISESNIKNLKMIPFFLNIDIYIFPVARNYFPCSMSVDTNQSQMTQYLVTSQTVNMRGGSLLHCITIDPYYGSMGAIFLGYQKNRCKMMD